jgi:hypothetical protein
VVPASATVSVTFSEPVTAAGQHLTLVEADTGATVPAVATWNPSTRRATLDPVADLAPGTRYRVDFHPTLRDAAGNPPATPGWTFETAPVGVTGFSPPRSIRFAAGAHTGYRFDATGAVTATRTFTLSAPSGAATSQRSTVVPGRSGGWLLVDNGVWAGYWIAESARAHVPGELDRVTFTPAKVVDFAAGSHTGYRFSASGAVTASKAVWLSRVSAAAASARAVINGRPHVLVANGTWAGYWLPESSRVVLR